MLGASPEVMQNALAYCVNENKPYIWQYRTLYEVRQRKNGKFYLKKIAYNKGGYLGVTRKGHADSMTKERAFSFTDETTIYF